MTLLQKNQLAEIAPAIKQTLCWMVKDAVIRNDETKEGDYSDELQLAITINELLGEIVE
jgi:hypothetical protein